MIEANIGYRVVGSVLLGMILTYGGYLYFAWAWVQESWHLAAGMLIGVFIICPVLFILGFTLISILWMVR